MVPADNVCVEMELLVSSVIDAVLDIMTGVCKDASEWGGNDNDRPFDLGRRMREGPLWIFFLIRNETLASKQKGICPQ